MANPPVNIFSQHCKPDEVLQALKKLLPNTVVETDDTGVWKSVKATWKRGWLKSSLELTVTHDPEYYAGAKWSAQLAGMAGYFRRFPKFQPDAALFSYIPGLAFAVSFTLQPGTVENDPRQAVIYEIARLVEGVIFLPGCLLDAEGHVLFSAEHEPDPEAKLPAHEPKADAAAEQAESLQHTPAAAPPPLAGPPSQERVVNRLLLMGALVNRSAIESSPDAELVRKEMVHGLQGSEIWREAEPAELAELETPAGRLSEKSVWRLPWQAEGAAVLAWALGLMELPPYDEQVEVGRLFEVISTLEEGESQPELRPPNELDALSFQMLAIHWRLRQFQVEPKTMDLVDYAPRAWCGPMDLSLARLAGSNIEIKGVPLAEATEEDWKTTSGIMHERRMAIHWLLGHAAVYSENDTAT